jgi:hypothetical protein
MNMCVLGSIRLIGFVVGCCWFGLVRCDAMRRRIGVVPLAWIPVKMQPTGRFVAVEVGRRVCVLRYVLKTVRRKPLGRRPMILVVVPIIRVCIDIYIYSYLHGYLQIVTYHSSASQYPVNARTLFSHPKPIAANPSRSIVVSCLISYWSGYRVGTDEWD